MRRSQLDKEVLNTQQTLNMQWLLPRISHRSCNNLDSLLKNFIRAQSPAPTRELNNLPRTHQILAHL